MVPGSGMLWIHWWYTVAAMYEWVESRDSVDLNFDVKVGEMGIVGTGRLGGII